MLKQTIAEVQSVQSFEVVVFGSASIGERQALMLK